MDADWRSTKPNPVRNAVRVVVVAEAAIVVRHQPMALISGGHKSEWEEQRMASNKRHSHKQPKKRATPPPSSGPPEPPRAITKRRPVQYGKPFILLEDANKNTFEFKNGAWVSHPMSIAEYRIESQVKPLPQKVNSMTRYEVRSPV